MINGAGSKKRFCTDIYFMPFKKIMEELYKGIDIQPWVHVENLGEFEQKMEEWGNTEYTFDS